MNEDEYESLPTHSMGVHMMAGACAGIMEHCVMYSVDSVKTRRQILSSNAVKNSSILAEIGKMMRQEGILRPFRGMSAMVVGAGPAHALYFSCYEYLKGKLAVGKSFPMNSHLQYASAGVVSTVLHDAIMNPAEVIKQRMQIPDTPYRTVLGCIRHVYDNEGIVAFYRSYRTTLLMNVPFQSIHFVTYEFVQSITNPQHIYNPTAHMVSGAMAGAVAATISMPLDVCKTVLNTQTAEERAGGIKDAIRLIYDTHGLKGFYRGLKARIIYQMPSTAICWSTYEFFKYLLQRVNNETSPTLDAIDDSFGMTTAVQLQSQRTVNTSNSCIATSTGTSNNSSSSSSGSSSFQGAGLLLNKPTTPVLLRN